MIINETLLKTYGAQLITLEKGDYLLSTETYPQNYYQIKSGSIKITSDKNGNNEFIHKILGCGDSVGETFLSSEALYSINALALSPTSVYMLSRDKFYELMDKHSAIMARLYRLVCQHANHQHELMNVMAYGNPRSKIITVMNSLRKMQKQFHPFQYEIPYTRKQLASLTGLTTETVIRTVKLLERENSVKIVDGKIYY